MRIAAALEHLLIEPARGVPPEDRQQVRWISYALPTLWAVLTAGLLTVPAVAMPQVARVMGIAVAAYFIYRTRYYKVGSYLLLVGFYAEPFAHFFLEPVPVDTQAEAMYLFAWCVLPVCISGILLSVRRVAVLASIMSLGLLVLGLLSARTSMAVMFGPAALIMMASVLTVTMAILRSQGEQRFRSLFEATVEGIALCRAGVILAVNPAFEEMFRTTAARAKGAAVTDFVGGGRTPEAENADRYITRGQRADGTVFSLEVIPRRGYQFVDLEVDVLALHDVTEREHVLEALGRAKDEAEAAAKAKSDFLARMSHEIRTPLNAVIGMNALLLDTPLDATQREFALLGQQSGKSLLALVNDILDFSKIDAGQLDIEVRPFELEVCVEAAVDLVTPTAADKDLDLFFDIEPGTPWAVEGDVARLEQVLVNLLGNAVKFTEDGQVELRLRALEQGPFAPGDEVTLEFTVRDTGIGISADRVDHLFEPFRQADTSTTRKYGGTGLGLAICKQLVDLMHGDIEVHSAQGMGSTFVVTARARVASYELPAHARAAQPQLAGRSALVLMSHPGHRASVRALLAVVRRGSSPAAGGRPLA